MLVTSPPSSTARTKRKCAPTERLARVTLVLAISTEPHSAVDVSSSADVYPTISPPYASPVAVQENEIVSPSKT